MVVTAVQVASSRQTPVTVGVADGKIIGVEDGTVNGEVVGKSDIDGTADGADGKVHFLHASHVSYANIPSPSESTPRCAHFHLLYPFLK